MRLCLVICFCIALASMLGCTGQPSEQTNQTDQPSMKRESISTMSDSVRIISLRTPMQIPALLRTTDALYNKQVLFPIQLNEKAFYQSTVLFGMYMVDLAYVGAFNDQQAALEYFTHCKRLGDDLGLGYQIESGITERLEQNISRPDSLGRLIMELYTLGHEYFKENEKEGLGLLMIMGCYFEGLHLVYTEAKENDLILFLNLMNQHKNYSENLIYALDGFEIPLEIETEYQMLVKSNELFKNLDAPSAYSVKVAPARANQLNVEILRELEQLTKDFRESMKI